MYYRTNNKRGYLLTTVLGSMDTQMELEDVEYYNPTVPGDSYKDRNIPLVPDEQIVLTIWGVQYSNPSADPDKEIVVATWTGIGHIFDIVRGQEGTTAGIHYVGDNVAGVFSAEMSRELLIFDYLLEFVAGTVGYTEDIDTDSEMEITPLVPDNEVSEEGYKKILVTGGYNNTEVPYWQFCWANEVGGTRLET